MAIFSTMAVDTLEALSRSQAVIEFNPDGTVLTANDNFLDIMGYGLQEIVGHHHRMFAEPKYAHSLAYKDFWEKLNRGEFQAAEYKRLGKDGIEVWIQATYNPIVDKRGKVVKVVKYASDITDQKLKNADFSGQIDAIAKSQAVIHFEMDGTIIRANDNFLDAMGYSLREIRGKHHSMFADTTYARSPQYEDFWNTLNRGDFQSGEYKRFGKGGKEVWIQASYNPIFDMNGKPFKVVKYASDITRQKLRTAEFEGQITAIGESQAVIHFDMDGTIIDANANFLAATNYSLEEIRGGHHSIFAEPAFAQSQEYKDFWAKLNAGEHQSAEYKRIGKGGKEMWIQASYHPIFDMNGKPFKVVKFANNITHQMKARIESSYLAREMASTIAGVATAAEEMTAAVSEISSSMARSKQSVEHIVAKTKHADRQMEKLNEGMKTLQGVVELIRAIARQVNVLALNATIEAVRAGDAGHGFAVVAAEVKNLAIHTRKATDDIALQINALQAAAEGAAASTLAVYEATGAVSQSVAGVASAIEQQSAVTREIAMNMGHASKGLGNINECILRISAAA